MRQPAVLLEEDLAHGAHPWPPARAVRDSRHLHGDRRVITRWIKAALRSMPRDLFDNVPSGHGVDE